MGAEPMNIFWKQSANEGPWEAYYGIFLSPNTTKETSTLLGEQHVDLDAFFGFMAIAITVRIGARLKNKRRAMVGVKFII